MTIRTMTMRDYDEVIAVWKASGLTTDVACDRRPMFTKTLDMNPKSCFVALNNKKIVGAVLGAFNGRRMWAYHLGVLPAYQKKGIGKKLMSAVEHACQKTGAPKLSLAVMKDNLDVIGFYRKLGFRPVTDSVWLSKAIGGAV
jgi:ribosomal protein S18 acetylase RimI-like enzyme